MQDQRLNQYSVLNKTRLLRVLATYLDPLLCVTPRLHA
jgi:hypothetical protein